MYSYGSPHMAAQKQDDQLERTFSSYVRIQAVVLKIYLGRWTIGRSGERGSGISVLPARYDDDDDDVINVWNLYVLLRLLFLSLLNLKCNMTGYSITCHNILILIVTWRFRLALIHRRNKLFFFVFCFFVFCFLCCFFFFFLSQSGCKSEKFYFNSISCLIWRSPVNFLEHRFISMFLTGWK